MELLAGNMKLIRNRYNLQQNQVADRINVTPQAYSKYESGQRYPDLDMLKRLADFYKLPITIFWMTKWKFEEYTYNDSLSDLGTLYDFELRILRDLVSKCDSVSKKSKQEYTKKREEDSNKKENNTMKLRRKKESYSDDEKIHIMKRRIKEQLDKIKSIHNVYDEIFDKVSRTFSRKTR
jgi:transcriptional regulator with XRE-family HTH domain